MSEPRRSGGPPARASTAVMFDMDGLLVDSEPLWLEAETAVMARLGADWTAADQVQLLGGSLDRTVRYLLGQARRPASPGQVAEWLMSGIVELARDRGVDAIASLVVAYPMLDDRDTTMPAARSGADDGAN